MRSLSIPEVLELHERIIDTSGGASGVRDLGALESAVAQPHATFGANRTAALPLREFVGAWVCG